ncbi:DUF3231 family protein [Halobacillus seohaensis]|uniref:DUF3231 family protein n=1 Tax=Halobacillus seohaensis TaxID=447421 RepID=A0ABW2ELQ8_9BACI
MQTQRLTSAEISQLWSMYMNDSMSVCTFKHSLKTVEDSEVRAVIEYGLSLSQDHVEKLKTLFQSENIPVPIGLNEQDVDLTAPSLYTDEFWINNVKQTGQMGLTLYSQALSLAARPDIQYLFSECLRESIKLREQAMDVLLTKGIYVRAPYITTPNKVDFVTNQNFLAGFFGEKRPLLSLEVANLYDNIQRNALGQQLLTGFQQVARSKKVRQYIERGKEIAGKHTNLFSNVLQKEELPASVMWDTGVKESTVPPFSDKLMMFQTSAMNAAGIAYYGTSMSTCLRRDLSTHYARLMVEIGLFAEDGINLMIENGWFEEPPRTINHNELAKGND